MATPRKATKARKTTKRAPTKRTQQPPTPPPEPEQSASPDFSLNPNGSISWRMGDTTYELQPLTAEAYIDLDWRRRGGGSLIIADLQRAADLPGVTDEEKAAKLEALETANRANYEWLVEWYAALFRWAERERREFPRAHAPAWIFRQNTMASLLDHLEGKAPPGVG